MTSSLITAAAMSLALATASSAAAEARNIVLVHGAMVDGSYWRAVHDILAAEGLNVSVVQNPLTGLDDDVAATRRILDLQDGPVVLVGHSYGGAVVTVAGADPDVVALVYVAAFQPDVGESVAELFAMFPPASEGNATLTLDDGYTILDPARFHEVVAADLPEADAAFLAHAQVPTSPDANTEEAPLAAWRDKPSWAVVTTEDRSVDTDLQRWMAERSGARVTELATSHLAQVAQPEAVAAVIMEAARSVE